MAQTINKTGTNALFIKDVSSIDRNNYLNLITVKFHISTYKKNLEKGQIILRIAPLEERAHRCSNKFSILDICLHFSMAEIEEMKNKLLEITQMETEEEDVLFILHCNDYNIEQICEKYFEIPLQNRKKEWDSYVSELKTKKNVTYKNKRYGDVEIAVFFQSFSYLKGLVELLKDESCGRYFKLIPKLENQNVSNNTNSDFYDLVLDIFILKSYVLNIYEEEHIPIFLTDILTYHDTIVNKYDYDKTQINTNNGAILNKTYKRDFFEHQKRNIDWMMNMESEINSCSSIEGFHIPHGTKAFPVVEIDDFLYVNTASKTLMSTRNFNPISIMFKGGLLCDNIGMGKTASMIGLIVETLQNNENPTLVLCPSRLCKQWKNEIMQTFDLNTVIVANIRQYLAFLKRPIQTYAVVIFSYNMFTNQKYIDQTTNLAQFNLTSIRWKRIIYDELHEQLNYKMFKKKETKNTIILQQILKLNSKYCWICSGTPYFDNLSFSLVIMFLTTIKNCRISSKTFLEDICTKHLQKEDCNLYTEYEKFVNDHAANAVHLHSIQKILCEFDRRYWFLFKKISAKILRKSIVNPKEIYIPNPEITTEFLEPDPIEKCIYESALSDKTDEVKMCSHIMVSADCEKILGSKILSLENIHKKMTNFYGTCIKENLTKLKEHGEELEIDWMKDKSVLSWTKSNIIDSYNEADITNTKTVMSSIDDFIQKYEPENELITKMKLIYEELQKVVAKFQIFTNFEVNCIENSTCPICFEELSSTMYVVLPCTHMFCLSCIEKCLASRKENCSICRDKIDKKKYHIVRPNTTNKWGTKIAYLVTWLKETLRNKNNKIIVFTQWDSMLKILKSVLDDQQINSVSISGPLNIVCSKIRKFKLDTDVQVMLLSSDKASSGLNLQEASHVVLFDTINDSFTEKQAIGRCVRIGQKKVVQVLRLIMQGTIEEKFFKKNI